MSLIFRLQHRLLTGAASRPSVVCRFRSKPLSSRHLSAHVAEEDDSLPEIDHRRLPADYDPADFDPTEHRSPPTPRVFRLVDQVAGLTLAEVADLSLILLKKVGMSEDEFPVMTLMKPGSAPPPTPETTGPGLGPTTDEPKQEKTAFEVKLEAYEAASKIKVIKEVRGFTSLGLKEAKELVEKAPVIVKAGVSKEEAEIIAKKMKAVGAKVVIE